MQNLWYKCVVKYKPGGRSPGPITSRSLTTGGVRQSTGGPDHLTLTPRGLSQGHQRPSSGQQDSFIDQVTVITYKNTYSTGQNFNRGEFCGYFLLYYIKKFDEKLLSWTTLQGFYEFIAEQCLLHIFGVISLWLTDRQVQQLLAPLPWSKSGLSENYDHDCLTEISTEITHK